MVENSARNMNKQNNKNVTSKPKRRPNPWMGESMFREPKNELPPMKPMRIYFPSKQRNNKKVKTNTRERLENILKTKNNILIIKNTTKSMNNREKAAQNLINRGIKYYREYMQSEGPSSGAPKILFKRAVYSLPNEAKVAAVLIAAASVYRTAKFMKNKGKYIFPFVLASMARK